MVFWPPNHGISTPTHCILIPYSWYIDTPPMIFWTPTNGITNRYWWYIDRLPMIFRPTYPWNKNTYPYPWYIDPQYFVPQPMLFCLSTHGISTPTHGIKTHLPIMYWPSYPWYIDPPAHGLLTHLPMVYWPPYPWHIIDPHTNLILTPIHSNLPTNHGISTLLPMVVSPLYLWFIDPLPMVYRPPIHVILTSLPMA